MDISAVSIDSSRSSMYLYDLRESPGRRAMVSSVYPKMSRYREKSTDCVTVVRITLARQRLVEFRPFQIVDYSVRNIARAALFP